MRAIDAAPAARKLAALLTKLAETLPMWCWWDVDLDEVRMQAETQAQVRELMGLFPGVVWKKEYRESGQWWRYQTRYDGIMLTVYNVKEAPPTCHVEYRDVEVEERVPVAYETKTVTKQVAVVTCEEEEAP